MLDEERLMSETKADLKVRLYIRYVEADLQVGLTASCARHQLTHHVGQNAAVAERHEFLRRVDPRGHCEGLGRAVGCGCRYAHVAPWLETLGDVEQAVGLRPGQLQRRGRLTGLEFERQDAHVHQVAAV